jgi:photosynthetic reaction center cytochrome c subunit
MFPKWFDKWNSDNPTNIFGPAIAVGVAGGGVRGGDDRGLGATLRHDQPANRPTRHRHACAGVRGRSGGDPDVEGYVTSEPIVPTAAQRWLSTSSRGCPRRSPVSRSRTTSAWWRRCGPGPGFPIFWRIRNDSYQTQVAYSMIEMTQNINQNWAAHVQANAEVGVTCYTCHRGQPVPNNVWFRVGPVNSNAAGWPAIQNRVTMTSNFTSLPSTYLEHFLLQDEDGFYGVAQVHDLASRVENLPGDPLIQQTEMTYAWMNYFANSLGVNCVFCHNSRAFYDAAQVTPQWSTASLGIIMVQEQLEQYILPLADVLPPNGSDPSITMCRNSPAAPVTRASSSRSMA